MSVAQVSPKLTPDDLLEIGLSRQTRIFREYHDLLTKTPAGLILRARLEGDPRVQVLNGKMVQFGMGRGRFEIWQLGCWYLWYAKQAGESAANDALDRYLGSPVIEVIITRWVLGVRIDHSIELPLGVTLVPLAEMPESMDAAHFRTAKFRSHLIPTSVPEAALIKRVQLLKLPPEPAESGGDNEERWRVSKTLREMALLFNALDGVCVEANLETTYTEPSVPMGMFGGHSGSHPAYDVTVRHNKPLVNLPLEKFALIYDAYAQLSEPEQRRYELILSRIAQAKRRSETADKILDLGVALEMLLLRESSGKDQLSLTFRLRGSWLLGINAADRQRLYGHFKDLYDLRSKVAHTGSLGSLSPQAARKKAEEFEVLACWVFRRLLSEGEPNWDVLLLGNG